MHIIIHIFHIGNQSKLYIRYAPCSEQVSCTFVGFKVTILLFYSRLEVAHIERHAKIHLHKNESIDYEQNEKLLLFRWHKNFITGELKGN